MRSRWFSSKDYMPKLVMDILTFTFPVLFVDPAQVDSETLINF